MMKKWLALGALFACNEMRLSPNDMGSSTASIEHPPIDCGLTAPEVIARDVSRVRDIGAGFTTVSFVSRVSGGPSQSLEVIYEFDKTSFLVAPLAIGSGVAGIGLFVDSHTGVLYEVSSSGVTVVEGGLAPRFVAPVKTPNADASCPDIQAAALGPDGSLYWAQQEQCIPVDSPRPPVNLAVLPRGATEGRIVGGDENFKGTMRVNPTHILWASSSPDRKTFGIYRMPKDGGTIELLTAAPVFDFAVDDAGSVYYSDNVFDDQPGKTYRLDGPGQLTPILDFETTGLGASGGFIYAIDSLPDHDPAAGNLIRFKPNGHGLTYFGKASHQTPPAFDEQNFIYYVDQAGTTLYHDCKLKGIPRP